MGAGALPVTENGLFRAEHRALRELYATARHMGGHWAKLANRLGDGDGLERGAAATRELLAELKERTAAHGLHGVPSAEGTGAWASRLRGASDVLLERNQALRSAVLEAEHVATLLGYLAELASRRDDTALAAWHRGWERRMRELQETVRAAAIAEAADPERAIEPVDGSSLSRAGHAVANGLGALGEAVDRRLGRR